MINKRKTLLAGTITINNANSSLFVRFVIVVVDVASINEVDVVDVDEYEVVFIGVDFSVDGEGFVVVDVEIVIVVVVVVEVVVVVVIEETVVVLPEPSSGSTFSQPSLSSSSQIVPELSSASSSVEPFPSKAVFWVDS